MADNSATIIMGDSGSGKTSLLATLFEWVYEKHGRISRLYTTDGGGYGDMMEVLVEAEIVEVWKLRSRDPDGTKGLPVGSCALATQGWWPRHVGPDGMVDVACELVPPMAVFYDLICPNGHKVKRAQTQGQLSQPIPCPVCKTLTTTKNCQKIEKVIVRNEEFERVGCIAFDGMTSMSDWCMSDISARAARGDLGGEKGNMNTVVSDHLSFGTAGRGGVGFVQNRALDWINNSITVRGLVVPPHFTALEHRAKDEDKMVIYGPQIAGSAKTAVVPSWAGNCLGTNNSLTNVETGEKEFRIYLSRYTEPGDNIPHLCKVRSMPGLPEYLADDPKSDPFTRFNLGYFWELIESAKGKAKSRLNVRFPDLDKGLQVKAAEVMKEDVREEIKAPVAPKPPAAPPRPAPPKPPMPGGMPGATKRPPAAARPTPRPPAAARPQPPVKG